MTDIKNNTPQCADIADSSEHTTHRALRKRKRTLGDRLEMLDSKARQSGLSEDEQSEHLAAETEWERVADHIDEIEDRVMQRPIRSRCDITAKLATIAYREGDGLYDCAPTLRDDLDLVLGQIVEWQQREPVCWP
jgi:hypothetical protein